MLSEKSESVITSCGQTALHYAVRRGLFDVMNKILNCYGWQNDLSFWMSNYTQRALDHEHPLKICSVNKNFQLLTYLLQLGIDPNVGLMQEYKDFKMLPTDVQREHHSLARFAGTPLNISIWHSAAGARDQRLLTINSLLYYGANPNIPTECLYTPLRGVMLNFSDEDIIPTDIIPTVQMMVLCGLDVRSEQFILNRLRSGITLGSPCVEEWLLWNIEQPMPLLHCCVVVIRTHLGPTAHQNVDSLPLAKQLKDYVLLRHVFKPLLVDSIGMIESTTRD